MRRLVGTAALLVGLSGLSGCADEFEKYCDEVAEQQEPLTEALAPRDSTALLDALPIFEQLREKAPSDIEDEWAIVVTRVSALSDALTDAGVDPEEYDAEEPEESVSDEDQDAITAAAEQLASQRTSTAIAGVQQQARDVCKTPLAF